MTNIKKLNRELAKNYVLGLKDAMTEDSFIVFAAKHDLHKIAYESTGSAALKAVKSKIADGKRLEAHDMKLLVDLLAESVAERAASALDYSGQIDIA